jgi:hypothetical protein
VQIVDGIVITARHPCATARPLALSSERAVRSKTAEYFRERSEDQIENAQDDQQSDQKNDDDNPDEGFGHERSPAAEK